MEQISNDAQVLPIANGQCVSPAPADAAAPRTHVRAAVAMHAAEMAAMPARVPPPWAANDVVIVEPPRDIMQHLTRLYNALFNYLLQYPLRASHVRPPLALVRELQRDICRINARVALGMAQAIRITVREAYAEIRDNAFFAIINMAEELFAAIDAHLTAQW